MVGLSDHYSAMVRATSMGATAEERKGTTHSTKISMKRKPTVSGIWPCKINGCNKQFAREADLKRHQRTTKLHSMPSYACPQCDATFTRTDAQRRHQKSRHNGVIIEAIETATEGDENSSSRSRSGTPLSKNNENPNGVPVQAHQGVPTATGPSSYYRQHTALMNPYIPPRIQNKTQHNQLVHPTSSARTAAPWPGYPHWPNGVPPPHMSTISYIHPPLCYPSPHYRPHTSAYPSPSPSDSSQQPNGAGPSTPLQTNSTDLSRNSPSHDSHDSSSISCIDPELDSYAELTAEDVVAAMRVVMSMQVKSAEEDAQDHETNQNGHDYMTASRNLEGDHINNLDLEDRLNGLHDYSPSLERPEPMEHILTEDGEPMLNPAELLTQESLASPPPS